MARSNESAVQRLQVGLVGLLSVLIFVSIASMILSRADQSSQSTPAQEAAKTQGQGGEAKAATDDPMVELGVTPVVPEQQSKPVPKQSTTQPQN